MKCEEFWESSPELAALPDNHAAECEACTRGLAEHRKLAEGLRAVAAELRSVEAPDRVERGLVSAFRSQHAPHPQRTGVPWLPLLTWAAAAAILIVLAMLTIRGREPVAPRRPVHRTVELASGAIPADWLSDDGSTAGEFIPLPNAEQVGENDDVNVVRVEVPRSAMLAVGLTVNPDRVSELVEADVMLGPDGLARAVRFVNE